MKLDHIPLDRLYVDKTNMRFSRKAPDVSDILPTERDHDKAPDHRVSAGGVEFGAGWTKAARETGAKYLSLKLDDPSLPAPIYATLTQGDNGEHKLIWSR
ncbi:DUF736 domain-containing protein [Sphingobium yanoikuyae]|jgi:uncharacterized protein (DUF736 family)|uniref:DUF736 domain-containing protein n=1 Tax=Sphingobium yanoikuyae TaxID=13690 RepID=UPI0028AFA28E|nr:DUF736 domain-containing protein [Sphingobium yanoikuyae]